MINSVRFTLYLNRTETNQNLIVQHLKASTLKCLTNKQSLETVNLFVHLTCMATD